MTPHSPDIHKVIDAYVALETDVQSTIANLFGNDCALCTSACCTPDICEESCDSAFLRAVRQRHEPEALFCDRFGWLSERGCALRSGRPPVCYGFFCNEIVEALSEHDKRVVRVLGRILSWVGERAIGQQHIVEPTDDAELQKLKSTRVLERIDLGHKALEGVNSDLNGDPVSETQLQAMQQVSNQPSLTRDM